MSERARLRELYIRQGLSLKAAAEELGRSRGWASREKAKDRGTKRDWDEARTAHLARSPMNILDALDAQLAVLSQAKRTSGTWSDRIAKLSRARDTVAKRNLVCRVQDGLRAFGRYCIEAGVPEPERQLIAKHVGGCLDAMREGRFGVQE